VLAIIGGFGCALAGATFVWTDALDPLFPLAGLLGLWAIVLRSACSDTPEPPIRRSQWQPVKLEQSVVRRFVLNPRCRRTKSQAAPWEDRTSGLRIRRLQH
jgi:hypothetical protein